MNAATDLALPILLVDDDPTTLFSAQNMLQLEGCTTVMTMEDSRQLIPLLREREIAAVLLDLQMPFISGNELLPEINHTFPHIPVIIMTAVNELEVAVTCMREGAFDYLVKPVKRERLIATVRKALELYLLRAEVSSLKQHLLSDRLEHESAFSAIVTRNKKMFSTFKYIEVVAPSRLPVLISGETGVGKELIARSIHALSGRKGAFVSVNSAGLDDAMFSDTLFGHKKGAFTGADQVRDGLITHAAGGTLFLDEIGDLNEASQAKLLRLLQENEYYPLGSDTPKKSDARIVVATNQDLHKLIALGKFRKDLFYRLRAHQIHIPPLRERKEDIPLLVDHFLAEAAVELRKKKPTPPPELITLLSAAEIPGNIRELRAMIFDAVARHKTGILSMDSFKEILQHERAHEQTETSASSSPGLLFDNAGRFPTLKEAEHFLIAEALKRAGGNQGIAASLLGITRQALNKRLNRNNR
ncbi:MAG: sigma-54 dependent transcriptional regulator [Nitrospirota bacterium]